MSGVYRKDKESISESFEHIALSLTSESARMGSMQSKVRADFSGLQIIFLAQA